MKKQAEAGAHLFVELCDVGLSALLDRHFGGLRMSSYVGKFKLRMRLRVLFSVLVRSCVRGVVCLCRKKEREWLWVERVQRASSLNTSEPNRMQLIMSSLVSKTRHM
jgi:hypothetical protein